MDRPQIEGNPKADLSLHLGYGAKSTSGNISSSSVTINLHSNKSERQVVLLGSKFYATYSESGTLTDNALTIDNWDIRLQSRLVGHQTETGDAFRNSVVFRTSNLRYQSMNNGEVIKESGTLIGVRALSGKAVDNTVLIEGSADYYGKPIVTEVSTAVYGAETNHYAQGNIVTIGESAKTLTAAGVYSKLEGAAGPEFVGNKAILKGAGSGVQVLAGAFAVNATATGNEAVVTNGSAQTVYGALVRGEGTVTENRAVITGGTVGTVTGGYAGSGSVIGNSVLIDLAGAAGSELPSAIRGAFVGGESMTGTVKDNTVVVAQGSTVSEVLAGGRVSGEQGAKPEISGNKVIIRGTYTGINNEAGTPGEGEALFLGDESLIASDDDLQNVTADPGDLTVTHAVTGGLASGIAVAAVPTSERAGIFGALAAGDAWIHDSEVVIETGAKVSGDVFASYHNGKTKAENNAVTVKVGADVSGARFWGQNTVYEVDFSGNGDRDAALPAPVMTQNSNIFRVDGFNGTIGKVSGFEKFVFANAGITDLNEAVVTITEAEASGFADTTVSVEKMTLPASASAAILSGESVTNVKLIAANTASNEGITFKYDTDRTFDVYVGTSLTGTGRLTAASGSGEAGFVTGEPSGGNGGSGSDTGNSGSGGRQRRLGQRIVGRRQHRLGELRRLGQFRLGRRGCGHLRHAPQSPDGTCFARPCRVLRLPAGRLGPCRRQARPGGHQRRGRSQFFRAVYGTSMNFDVAGDLDIQGTSAVLGWGFGGKTALGGLAVSVFYEYSNGDFTTENTFGSTQFEGSGDVTAHGFGAAARLFVTDSTWLEAALRGGQLKNKMSNTLMDGSGSLYGYETKSTYIGASVGAGHTFTITDTTSFDLSARYMVTHVASDDFAVGEEQYTVDASVSHRARVRGDLRYAV